ncbi:unnamed protein product [Chrysodeixis includens]|uniref:Probable RNA polymerase II nuclear localization protein SLC7A6OS n=1 Tax=Chrysodeixis includens TaxID=689277 RepID=A0A9P0C4B3_CHRIL|nr:unnamed protein product [Chrysodeixis includens]
MTASTVLRVKRRLEENPQDALVLMCKRIKKEFEENEEIAPSLFVFRGTVDSQETTHVKDILPKTDIKHQRINAADIIKKMRKERKDITTENRYRLLNCSRGVKDSNEDSNVYNLIDFQKTDENEDDVTYAYDLYTSYKDFDISMVDNIVSVETEILLDSYQDPFTSDIEGDDEDDSNDENNWRNEYPDSEASSIELEDMIRAMANVDMEDNLSSDEGEDRIYDQPSGVNQADIENYGAAYAKYKAKVLAENPDLKGSKLVHYAKDESYKDDSDGFYYGEEEDTEHFKEQYGASDRDSDDGSENSPD